MIIDGKKEAEIIESEIKKEISDLKTKIKKIPSLTVILIGDYVPSQIYVKNKEKIINAIHPSKDVDGFNPVNVGNLSSGYKSIVPCTPLGCLLLIKKVEPDLSGKHAVIIGRSNLNGKPMAQLLLKENCTVTVVHSKTNSLQNECLKADILVAAAGVPNLVKRDWVKEDVIAVSYTHLTLPTICSV